MKETEDNDLWAQQSGLQGILEFSRPMNKSELCSYFRIERNTLEYYNMQGLPRFKIGNETRYYVPDVLDFFRNRGIDPKKERFAYASEVER